MGQLLAGLHRVGSGSTMIAVQTCRPCKRPGAGNPLLHGTPQCGPPWAIQVPRLFVEAHVVPGRQAAESAKHTPISTPVSIDRPVLLLISRRYPRAPLDGRPWAPKVAWKLWLPRGLHWRREWSQEWWCPTCSTTGAPQTCLVNPWAPAFVTPRNSRFPCRRATTAQTRRSQSCRRGRRRGGREWRRARHR